MKILLFSDIHWSTHSSIVRSNGRHYSTRLEYLINSMNWVNATALNEGCEAMICAGDFFDKAVLNDQEITALREIKWNVLPCYFVCGNHESSMNDLSFNTLKTLETNNHFIITDQCWSINDNVDTQIHFVPYIVESNRQNLADYLDKNNFSKHIVVSHNDIAGIQYGCYESKLGFTIDEIEESCDLYLNGHLHNSEFITKKILNLGSFSGHNFTNDSLRYSYGIWILDTSTLELKFIENPYSLNFYKFDVDTEDDLSNIRNIKQNAVLNIRCKPSLLQACKDFCDENRNMIIDKKITINRDLTAETTEVTIQDLQVDPLEKFAACCRANIANTAVLEAELSEICK